MTTHHLWLDMLLALLWLANGLMTLKMAVGAYFRGERWSALSYTGGASLVLIVALGYAIHATWGHWFYAAVAWMVVLGISAAIQARREHRRLREALRGFGSDERPDNDK